jgi:hypothetical protein
MEAATLIAFTLFQRSRPPCASTARLSKSSKLIVPFFLLLDRSLRAGSEQPFLEFRFILSTLAE